MRDSGMKFTRMTAWMIAAVLAAQAPTYAWGPVGHMAVAYVAYQQLDHSTKDRVDALLMLNPDRKNWLSLLPKKVSSKEKKMRIFMIAATWPDRIKSLTQYSDDSDINKGNRPNGKPSNSQNIGYSDLFKHKYWHFIDTPFSQDGTPLDPIPDPNAQTQIIAFRKVIASSDPDALKSYDLSWLLHLVGDVHQPLHAAARFSADVHGDDGGNLVMLCKKPCKDELHGFWDGLPGSGNLPSTAITYAKKLSPAGPEASDLDTTHWINESFDLAKNNVYVDPPIGKGGAGPYTLTNKYKTDAKLLAQKQIALAGMRLGKMLNAELK